MRFWCDRTGHGAGCVRLFCPVRGAARALLSGEKGRGFVRVEALARGGCGPLAALFVLPCTNRRNTVAAEGPASDRPGRWLRLLRRMLHWQLSHPPLREIGDARRKFFLTMGAAVTIISHNSKGAVAWTTAPLSVFSGNTVKRNEGEEYCGDSVPASGGW